MPMRPPSRSSSIHSRCSRQLTRLWICSTSTLAEPVELTLVLLATPSSVCAQIFVASVTSSRQPSKATASDASASCTSATCRRAGCRPRIAAATTRVRATRVAPERPRRAEAHNRAEFAFFHQRIMPRDATGGVSGGEKRGILVYVRAPYARAAAPRRPRAVLLEPLSTATVTSPTQSSRMACVWWDTPRWRSRSSASRPSPRRPADRRVRTRCSQPRPPRARRDRGAFRSPRSGVDRADGGVEPRRLSSRRARKPSQTQCASPSMQDSTATATSTRPRPSTRGRRRRGKRAALRPAAGAARSPADARADRSDLAVQRAADDRHAGEPFDQLLGLSPACGTACWSDVYGSFQGHGRWLGEQVEPAGQGSRGAGRSRPSRARGRGLDVDDHLVALFILFRQPRVGDAWRVVDLTANEFAAARRRPSRGLSKRERHRAARATRPPSPSRRRRRCARRGCGSLPSRLRA